MADNKKEGYVYGEWRKAINAAANVDVKASMYTAGAVHNEEVAKKVGMRGGVVAGTVHHDLFAPILLKMFGQRWFEQGTLSMFFMYALLQDEKLRAVVQIPPKNAKDAQVEVWLESEDGHRVGEGTVSIGNPKVKSHLQAMELKSSPKEERRILKDLEIGWEIPMGDAMVKQEADGVSFVVNGTSSPPRGLSHLEDTIPWYKGNTPWGSAIVPLSWVYGLMRLTLPFKTQGVGFFGADEIKFVNGPIRVDVPYKFKFKVIAAGATSKTEYLWQDAQVFDSTGKKLVATGRHMTRWMKAGSPLYPEIK
jgi:hypothetical protein